MWEQLRGPNHRFVAQALAAQAIVIRDHESAANAIPLLERALSINELVLGPQHRLVAETLTDLAVTYLKVRRNAEANRLTARAQQIWAAAGDPDDHAHAITRALAAQLAAERGDLTQALHAYEHSLAIEERVFGKTHPETAQVRLALARTQALSHRGVAALASAQDAESSGREHLRLMLRALAERQALTYAAIRPRGLDLMLSLVDSTLTAAPAGIDAVIRSRALVLDELCAEASLGDWREAGQRYAGSHAGQCPATTGQPRRARGGLDAALRYESSWRPPVMRASSQSGGSPRRALRSGPSEVALDRPRRGDGRTAPRLGSWCHSCDIGSSARRFAGFLVRRYLARALLTITRHTSPSCSRPGASPRR